MKGRFFLRTCAAVLAACVCVSAGGCSNQGTDASSGPSSTPSSSAASPSQPDIVGSSQAPLPETQPSIQAPAISIENRTADNLQQRIAAPQFSGFAGADELNGQIEQEHQRGVSEIRSLLDESSGWSPESPLFYQSVFDYQENGLLSVWLTNGNYTGGAHGMSWISSYNLDPETGEFYAIRDLFRKPDEAIPQITEKILSYLKATITDDADSSLYQSAEQAVRALGGDYHYYLDGENLVIYFQPYDILPYAAGIVRVPLSISSLPDMTVQLRAVPARRTIRVNGQDTDLGRNMMIGADGDTSVLLPMPETARLCGMEATVKNQMCTIDGKEYPVTYANGGAFMNFTDFLAAAPDDEAHLATYGPDEVLRIYTVK